MVLADVLAYIGCEPWCSRGLRRSPVAAIFLWVDTRTGTIDGLAWTGVGLHALHARPVRTAPGFSEGYRPRGSYRPRVPGGPLLMASQTAFGHHPIHWFF